MGLPLSYTLRNVRVRVRRTVLTIVVVALAVVAISVFLTLISSLTRTLVSTGSPDNLVILRKGSDNDGSSMLQLEAYRTIRYLDGIARDRRGRPLVSPEIVVQPFVATHDGGRENVLVRGVEPVALAVHGSVRVTAGRMFRPSTGEVVVGAGVARRYAGAELGAELTFGRGRWRVVGIFESGGSSFESEIWADARQLAADAARPFPYSSIRLRVAPGADRDRLIRRIEDDPRFALEATPEVEYYRQQAENTRTLYLLLIALAVPIGVAAGFGTVNTMLGAVQSRRVEIGTLRALGFSRGAVLRSFLLESLGCALVGFVAGALGTFLVVAILMWVLGGIGFSAETFSTNVVTLTVHPRDLAAGLAAAVVIGLGGGLLPAWRAASLTPVKALRRA